MHQHHHQFSRKHVPNLWGAGSAVAYSAGNAYGRRLYGRGFFSKNVFPLLRDHVFPWLKRQVLNTGQDVAQRLLSGEKLAPALKAGLKSGVKRGLSGGGGAKKRKKIVKKKKTAINKKKTTVKRKNKQLAIRSREDFFSNPQHHP